MPARNLCVVTRRWIGGSNKAMDRGKAGVVAAAVRVAGEQQRWAGISFLATDAGNGGRGQEDEKQRSVGIR